MEKLISVLLCILLTTFSLAGCLGDSDNETSEDTDNSENTGNNETIILFEGDQAGECSDGADNDRDGLFDCDDPNCAGSPTCKISEENNTNLDENNTLTGDEYSDFDDKIMVNLTNDMITSGYMDEANCNLLLILQGWSPVSAIIKNELLQTGLANTPNYRIWIATYEDVDGSVLLPALYDWRNGEVDTTSEQGIYVFDDDEVSYLGGQFSSDFDLGNICLPSQRDGLTNLFELIDPPFIWSLPILTAGDFQRFNQSRNSNEPLCEIIILNSYYTGDDLEELHDYAVTAISRVGESNVNFWFMNTSEHENVVPTYVMEALNYHNGAPWNYIPSSFGELFFIIDTFNTSDSYFGQYGYNEIGEPCNSEDREDVYHFFHEYGLSPFTSYSWDGIGINVSLEISYENQSKYDDLEISMVDNWRFLMSDIVHTDSILLCLINEENHEYFTITNNWLINNQTVQGELLDLNEYNLSVGDSVTCSIQIEDLLTGRILIDNWELNISNRRPLAHNLEIIQGKDLITCDFEILNPDNQDYVALVTWIVDSNDDGILSFENDWHSLPSTNYTLNETNPSSEWTFTAANLSQGNHISCVVEIFTPEDASLIVDYDFEIWQRILFFNSVEGKIE